MDAEVRQRMCAPHIVQHVGDMLTAQRSFMARMDAAGAAAARTPRTARVEVLAPAARAQRPAPAARAPRAAPPRNTAPGRSARSRFATSLT